MTPQDRLILLSNDDGILSEGIEALHRVLDDLAQVFIVAPDREKSATSLSLTLRRPLRVQKVRPNIFAVDGTPADCIYMATKRLLPRKPDLIISGMNKGPNLGQQDVSYSGTVAAAVQGTFLSIPSVAISVLTEEKGFFAFDQSAKIARTLARVLLENRLPEGVSLNVNIPPPPFKGIRITRLGQKIYDPEIIEKSDPRGNIYYWIGSGNPVSVGDEGTDIAAVGLGYISITPLHTDMTDYQALEQPIFQSILSRIENEDIEKTL